jgi:F-type H+-transporting ATPase subunit delta
MSAAGKRYAQALMASLGTANPEKVLSDLEDFERWLSGVSGLCGALENPGIPAAAKEKVVRTLTDLGGFEAVSVRFVLLVVANHRLRLWAETVGAYRSLCDGRKGVVRARVRTARPMSVSEVAEMAGRLGKILGGAVEVETGVSPALLGGVELRLGSTVYDGTVAGALKAMHHSLVKG